MMHDFPRCAFSEILKFCAKTSLLALAVMTPLVVIYIWLDPYHVIRSEAAFLPNPTGEVFGEWEGRNYGGPFNTNHLYLENYWKQKEGGHNYKGFIFGSSISQNVHIADWREAAAIPDSIEIIHLGTNGESIDILADKIRALDRNGVDFKHVLIVTDAERLSTSNPPNIAEMNSLRIPPGTPIRPFYGLIFHYQIFKSVINIPFLSSYIPSALKDSDISVGKIHTFSPILLGFDPLSGEETVEKIQSLRKKDMESFRRRFPLIDQHTVDRHPFHHALSPNLNYWRPSSLLNDSGISLQSGEGLGNYLTEGFPHSVTESISATERKRAKRVRSLRLIAEILNKHSAEVMILITPCPDGRYVDPADLRILYRIFGEEHVRCLDQEYMILNQDTMMWDYRHFSPQAGRYFLMKAYGKDK